MSVATDRRRFLQTTAVAGLGYWVAGGVEAAESKSPNEQIQVGCIGVGGKGQSDVQNMSKFGKIYALCDVDSKILDGMVKPTRPSTISPTTARCSTRWASKSTRSPSACPTTTTL